MIKLVLISIFLLCISCTPTLKTYRLGEGLNFLTVKVGTKNQIQEEYEKIMGIKAPKGLVGFYRINTHTIYTINDFNILLHELWHAGGNLEEPPWEVK